ncbi:MAG: PepSY-like domain-containing protein [Bacteroides sp.]|nr:PepSY-like domain-containing protein [Bacteroides sp.]
MKLKMFFAMLTLGVSAWMLQSCDDDDDLSVVPVELTDSLSKKYPQATRVEWENDRGYYIADFYENGWERTAWFTPEGIWQLTETEIRFTDLPDAVQTAFRASTYATWEMEDVDMVERLEMEVVYVIEVEQYSQEMYLYYAADGVLVREETGTGEGSHGGSDYLPGINSGQFSDFLNERYPGARIIEVDREANGYEVDIVHDGRGKEVMFDLEGAWMSSTWDVRINEVPEVVKAAAQAQYPDYRFDDADFVETPTASYYLIEMEQNERDVKVKVSADGTVL